MKRFHVEESITCRLCGGSDLLPYIDLGVQPPANSFIGAHEVPDEQAFPLAVRLCRTCGMSQLSHVVSAADIFDDYAYLSSTSQALCAHYQALVDGILADVTPPPGALMVDIGCNDGVLLKAYPNDRYRLLGVEPSSAGGVARDAGFDVDTAFFDAAAGARLRAERGAAAVVTATNVFAHVDDIASFAEGVHSLLGPGGVFVTEFPYLGDMLDGCYFDTIYHEHLSYLALTPLVRLFGALGLRPFRLRRSPIGASGPALQLFVCRADADFETETSIDELIAAEAAWGVTETAAYEGFASRVADIRRRILALVQEVKDAGGRIGAFGAPAKGNTLLNHLGLTADDIVAAAENNRLKVGKLTPGSHIPIVDDDAFLAMGLSHALLLTWNYADFFVANAPFITAGGKFIVPLPTPCIRP